jgi:hypothetical protein
MSTESPSLAKAEETTTRKGLRRISIIAALLSAFITMHCTLMTTQFLSARIPTATIKNVGHYKSGYQVELQNGDQAEIPYEVLIKDGKWIKLREGDIVEKQADSPVYVLNGVAVTDRNWLLRAYVRPPELEITLGIYLLLGASYAVLYRRSPIGDVFRERSFVMPASIRNLFTAFLAMITTWLTVAVIMLVVFGCLMGSLQGFVRAIRS